MLDDEFAKIEEFLQSQNKESTQFLQKFNEEVTEHINKIYDFSGENAQAHFLTLYQALNESYTGFIKSIHDTIQDFSVSLVLIKNILEQLNKRHENFSLLEDTQKEIFMLLMNSLIGSLKEECTTNINFFKTFEEYIDNFIAPMNIKD